MTDPGHVPKDWASDQSEHVKKENFDATSELLRQRWCRKCSLLKPPRSHHCKTCGR